MDEPNRDPDDAEGLYRVAPRDPDIVDYEPQILRVEVKLPEKDKEEEELAPLQFTLGDLFLLMTVTAFFLGVWVCLPWNMAAGVLGTGVFVALMILTGLHITQRRAHVVWWATLLVYLFISLAAIIKK